MKVFSLATLGALALAGCAPDYATNSTAPVVLLMTGINDGRPLASDVRTGSDVCPDFITLRLENHVKNPNIANSLDYRGDIVVRRYEVAYYRSDGRGAQGVDVPYTISGNLSFEVISDSTANMPIEVVRRQAKIEPPLTALADNGRVVTMFGQITLYGETTIGQGVTVQGSVQIDFANFGDSGASTGCPLI